MRLLCRMSTRSPCRCRCCSPSRSRSCPPSASRRGLGLHLDAFPEGDIASDVLGGVLGRGVIPGGVLVDLAVYFHVIVTGLALPRAGRVRCARFEVLTFDRIGREVVIAFDDLALVAFGEHGPVPDCFCHGILRMLSRSAAYAVVTGIHCKPDCGDMHHEALGPHAGGAQGTGQGDRGQSVTGTPRRSRPGYGIGRSDPGAAQTVPGVLRAHHGRGSGREARSAVVSMAWYRIAYRPAVLGDLAKIEKASARRLLEKTKWLASNVENLRHEPISPDLPGLSKYAVGEWRIFYSIDREEYLVDVHLIAHPKDLSGKT